MKSVTKTCMKNQLLFTQDCYNPSPYYPAIIGTFAQDRSWVLRATNIPDKPMKELLRFYLNNARKSSKLSRLKSFITTIQRQIGACNYQ